jgi:uncharacterized protein
VMQKRSRSEKSAALQQLGDAIFDDAMFTDTDTGVGIVTTRWVIERPMIFKTSIGQAHGRTGTFSLGLASRCLTQCKRHARPSRSSSGRRSKLIRVT